MSDKIQVAIRLRPLNEREKRNECILAWKTKDDNILIPVDSKIKNHTYIFDRVYNCDETTSNIYDETVEPIVHSSIEGFNGTIFAYGQTSSGKTFTMSGYKDQMGIIPLSVRSIFTEIDQSPNREFLLRVSYMEIYNEKITDLLDPEEKILKLMEDEKRQVHVSGLHEEVLRHLDDVLMLKTKGDSRRRVAETARNEESSRSHAIFRMIIESRERQYSEEDLNDESIRLSSLYFIDLAGSEKASENSGERFREGCAINKSLMILGQVISKLSDGVSNKHINYRDSKITRLLQNGLGGNSKTAIICTINPTVIEETNSTLRFATRAKTIKNQPMVNEVTDMSDKAILKRYQQEIVDLRTQLEAVKRQTTHKNMNPYCEYLENKKHTQEKEQLERKYQSKIDSLKNMICVPTVSPVKKKITRRETWCPGVLKRKLEVSASVYPPSDMSTPSRLLGSIEETPTFENADQSGVSLDRSSLESMKAPVMYADCCSQTDKSGEREMLLQLENEMLKNQLSMLETQLKEQKDQEATPAKQRRVSMFDPNETKEFLEMELQCFQDEKDSFSTLQKEHEKLDLERRKFKEAKINHDTEVRVFEAEQKELHQKMETTQSENVYLLNNLQRNQERVKTLEHELNRLQTVHGVGSSSRRSMDRPLLNMSNITSRSVSRSSREDTENLREQVFSLESEVQNQETKIEKMTQDLEKSKDQLKKKFEEIRFLSLLTTQQKQQLEILQKENEELKQIVHDKTPIFEQDEYLQLKSQLTEVTKDKEKLNYKLEIKAEELMFLSRRSAEYKEQLEDKIRESGYLIENNNGAVIEDKVNNAISELKEQLKTLTEEKEQMVPELNIARMYSENLKEQLNAKNEECSMVQKNLDATYDEVMEVRKCLVEIKEQLLAKDELILELSQIENVDASIRQSRTTNSSDCEVLKSTPKQDVSCKVSKDTLSLTSTNEISPVEAVSDVQQNSTVDDEQLQFSTLKEKYIIKDGECRKLSEEMERLKREYYILTKSRNSNDDVLMSLLNEIETKSSECDSLQEKLFDAKQETDVKTKECLELVMRISTLEEMGRKTQCATLVEELTNVKQSTQIIEIVEPKQDSSLRKVPAIIVDDSDNLATKSPECTDILQNQCVVMETESIEEAYSGLGEETKKLKNLQDELNVKKDECTYLVNPLRELHAISEYSVLQVDLNSVRQERDALQQQLSALAEVGASVSQFQSELNAKTEECAQLFDKLNEVKEKNLELQKSASNNDNNEKLVNCQHELWLKTEECQQLQEELSNMKDDFTVLKQSLDEFQDSSQISDSASQNQLAECQENLEIKTQECVALDEEIASLRKKVEVKSEECASLTEQIEDQSSSRKVLIITEDEAENCELTQALANLQRMQQQCEEKKAEIQNLSDQINHFQKNSIHIEGLLAEEVQQKGLLKNEFHTTKVELDAKIEQCTVLTEELHQLKQEFSNFKNLKVNEMQAKKCSLEEIESKSFEYMSKKEENEWLQKEIAEKTSQLDEMTEENDRLQESVYCGNCTLASLKTESVTSQLQLEIMKEDYISENSNLNNKIEFLEKSLESAEEQVQLLLPLKEELSTVHEQLSVKSQECNQFIEELSAAKEERNDLKTSLLNFHEENSHLSCHQGEQHTYQSNLNTNSKEYHELADLKKEIESLKMSLLHINEENQRLLSAEVDLCSIQFELKAKTEEYNTLLDRESVLESQNKEFLESINSKEEEILSIKADLGHILSELTAKTEEYNTLLDRESVLESQNKEFLESINSKEEEILSIKADLFHILSELKAKTEEYNTLLDRESVLESQNKEFLESINSKEDEILIIKNELELKITRVGELEELHSWITNKLNKAENENESLKESLIKMDERNDSLTNLQDQLCVCEKQLKAKTEECVVLSSELELKLQDSKMLKECEGKLTAKSQDCLYLSEQLSKLKEKEANIEEKFIKELEEKYKEHSHVSTELLELKQNKMQQAEDLEKQLTAKTQECDSLLEQVKVLEKNNANSLKESLTKMDERNDSLTNLQDQLCVCEKQLKAKTEECVVLSSELELKLQDSKMLKECEGKLTAKSQDCLYLSEQLSKLKEKEANIEEKFIKELEEKYKEHSHVSTELLELKQNKMQQAEDLEKQLTAKTQECDSLLEQVKVLEKNNANSLKESLTKMDERNDSLTNLQDQLCVCEKQLKAKTEECVVLSSELELKLQDSKMLKECEGKLTAKSKDCLYLSEQLSELKEKEANIEEKFIKELEEKYKEHSHVSTELLELKQNKMQQAEDLEKQLTAKTQECDSLLEQVKVLEKNNANILKESLTKMGERDASLTNLQDQLCVCEKQLKAKTEECVVLSSELELKLQDSKMLKECEGKLTAKLQDCLYLSEQLSELKEKEANIEEKFTKELEKKYKEHSHLSNELLELKQSKMQQAEDLEKQLTAKTQECDSSLANLQDQLCVCEKQLKAKTEECVVLSSELELKLQDSKMLKECEGKLTAKSQDCLYLSEQLSELKEKEANIEEKFIKELEEKYKEHSHVSTELLELKQNKMQQAEDLEKQLTAKTQECDSLLEQVKVLEKNNANSLKESLTKMGERDASLTNLQDQLCVCEKQLKAKTEECVVLSSELELKLQDSKMLKECERKLTAKLQECLYLSKQLSELKEKEANIEVKFTKELEKKYKEHSHLSTELLELKQSKMQQAEDLEKQLTAKTQECDSLLEQVKILEKNNANIQSHLEKELKEKCQQYIFLSNQFAALQNKYSELEKSTLDTVDKNSAENGNDKYIKELKVKNEECVALKEQLLVLRQQLHEEKKEIKKMNIMKKEQTESMEYKDEVCKLLYECNTSVTLEVSQLKEQLEKQDSTMETLSLQKNDTVVCFENQLKEKDEECANLTMQLQKVQIEKEKEKSMLKKVKLEKLRQSEVMETLEVKAGLCEFLGEEVKIQNSKIKELEDKLETTMGMSGLECEPVEKLDVTSTATDNSELQNRLKEKSEECISLSVQVKEAHEENNKETEKMKSQMLQLTKKIKELEGKTELVEVLQYEIKTHLSKIEKLGTENIEYADRISKLEIEIGEKQECITKLETHSFDQMNAQELESLQIQLSKQNLNIMVAESSNQIAKAQFHKQIKSYEETIKILNNNIRGLKEELRRAQSHTDEPTVKILHTEGTRSDKAESDMISSRGFVDHLAVVTLEAEQGKLNRKIEGLKQKLVNAMRNNEDLKKQLNIHKENVSKENTSGTPSKGKKVTEFEEKSTNTDIPKLTVSQTVLAEQSDSPCTTVRPDSKSTDTEKCTSQ